MFFKIFKYDFKNAIIKKYKNYIFSLVLFSAFISDFFLKIKISNILPQDATVTELFFFLFNGMKEYVPTSYDPFKFPIMWMLIYVLIFFFTLYYPYNDIMGYGKNVLIASTSRRTWWLSKCLTTFCMVIVYYLTAVISTLIFAVAYGLRFDLDVSLKVFESITKLTVMWDFNPTSSMFEFIVTIFVLPLLSALALCFLQMLLTLLIRPFASLIIVTSVIMVSAYYVSPVAIGNYAMSQRSTCFIPDGVSPTVGLVVMIAVAVISIIVSTILFENYEIINKE